MAQDRRIFHNVSFGLRASHEDVITQFDHYGNWLQSLELLLGAEYHLTPPITCPIKNKWEELKPVEINSKTSTPVWLLSS